MIKVQGEITLPGDKSISHRAALFSSFIPGEAHFTNFNFNEDCTSTLKCLKSLGIKWWFEDQNLVIEGKSLENWRHPQPPLDAGNSGTTARLISGILSNLPFETTLIGDESLSKRPMDRILKPLISMGARINSNKNRLPLYFSPSEDMRGIKYKLPVASAQVKSAVLLSGLFAEGITEVIETTPSRDHTERMLQLEVMTNNDGTRSIFNSKTITFNNLSMEIPGDVSSAAFYICAALGIPNSELTIKNVSLNPTRTGILKILEMMGANIEKELLREEPEPIGILRIRHSKLNNIEIPANLIPNIIDEIPILSILATQASGHFVLHDAEELRYKESDRIEALVSNLKNLDIEVTEFKDGLEIIGPQKLSGGLIQTFRDHRIAMAFAIANLFTTENISLDYKECVAVSFPDFLIF